MKLASLIIKNFKRIGEAGCEIRIDKIVVLVGQNNVGKSTVLDAYEAFAAASAPLSESFFHKEDVTKPIEITGIFREVTPEDEDKIGKSWAYDDVEYGRCVKVRFVWTKPGVAAQKQSFSPEKNDFIDGGVGGIDALIQSRIPKPIRIKPTDATEITQAKIVSVLKDHVKTRLKTDSDSAKAVFEQINLLTDKLFDETRDVLGEVSKKITDNVAGIFPGITIELVPKSKESLDEKIVGSESYLRIGANNKDKSPLAFQGTGLQRALLWSALAVMAGNGSTGKKKAVEADSTKILLIDEPEAFLHPPTVRGAREALYNFALNNPEWQVIATTHSPIFIDLSKDHTTIVRVDTERREQRFIATDKISFDAPQKQRLQMIRACNPMINEFFFYDDIVLVEGPTENLAVQHVAELLAKPVHVIDCMGKGNIPLFAKILNQFKAHYLVIHDSDTPKITREGKYVNSGTWTLNTSIRDAVAGSESAQIFTQFPHFEGEFLGETLKAGKVDNVLDLLERDTSPEYNRLVETYVQLLDGNAKIFTTTPDAFDIKLARHIDGNKLHDDPAWSNT